MCPKRPCDRAEYSLHQAAIVIALVLGGATLLCVGALRLRGSGFASMPRPVARLAAVGGAAVAVFGVVFAFVPPGPAVPADVPRARLEPVADGGRGGTGISGVVTTPDGARAADVPVALVPLFDGARAIHTLTDASGSFWFATVHVDLGTPYVAEASFDGARFPSEVLRAPRGRSHPVRLVVAETTRSPAALRMTSGSVAVVGDADGAQAIHAFSIRNAGDKAFVGGLRLPLLPGATAIQEGSGLDRRYLAVAGGEMVSRAPVLPGTHELTYTYILQMSRRGIDVELRTQLPTARYELLVGGSLTAQRTRGVDEDGEVTLGARGQRKSYHRYVGHDLDAGARIGARIEVARPNKLVRAALPLAAALAAAALVIAPLVRRRRTSGAADQAPEPSPTTLTA